MSLFVLFLALGALPAAYWTVGRPTDEELSTSVQLLNDQGFLYGQSDNVHPNQVPTIFWQPGQYGRDVHHLHIFPGTPPGKYHLRVGVYPRLRPDQPLSVLDVHQAPQGVSAIIAAIEVPHLSLSVDLSPSQKVPLDEGIALVGVTLHNPTLSVGERLRVTLWWHSQGQPVHNIQALLYLRNADKDIVATYSIPPVPGYATSAWQPGDLWRGEHDLRVPVDLAAGSYHLYLGDSDLPIGTLDVRVPERRYTQPSVAINKHAVFGTLAELVGYEAPHETKPDSTLKVRLVWHVLSESERSYKAFVHLLGADGRLITGSDAVPANWTRPTTGWALGEYIEDEHAFTLPMGLPQGEYRLEIGLYDAETLQRVPLSDGADSLLFEAPVRIAP